MPFFAISAMKTATWIVVRMYVTHGILCFGFFIKSILLLPFGLDSSINRGGAVRSLASYTWSFVSRLLFCTVPG
jgi:hypothetical protein